MHKVRRFVDDLAFVIEDARTVIASHDEDSALRPILRQAVAVLEREDGTHLAIVERLRADFFLVVQIILLAVEPDPVLDLLRHRIRPR